MVQVYSLNGSSHWPFEHEIVKNTSIFTLTLCWVLILLTTYDIGCRNKLGRSCAFVGRYSNEDVVW